MIKRRFILWLFLLCVTSISYGQMMWDSVFILRQVDIISSRQFQKETAGMKKTVIDSVVMLQKINLSLAELLSENTPVFIKNYGRGALSTASFRGTAPSHTQVTWNGIPLNTPMAGMVDFSLIPVFIADKVELNHGAASINNGAGGLGGSVNLTNNANWSQPFSLQFIQGIGSYNTFNNYLKINLGGKKLSASSRIYRTASRNDFAYVNKSVANIDPETGDVSHPIQKNRNAGYNSYGLMQEFYFKPNQNNIFALRWWEQFSDRSLPMLMSFEGNDDQNLNSQQETDSRLVGDWNYYMTKAKFLFRFGYSSKNLNYRLINQVPGLGEVPVIFSESRQKSFFNTALFQYDFSSEFSVKSSVKYAYHRIFSEDSVAKTGYCEDQNLLSWMLALQQNLGTRLNLNVLLRYEMVDGKLMPLVPFLGFDFLPVKDKTLIVSGNIARNYHRPALNDLYWQPGGNPDLLAEDGFGFEMGLKDQFNFKGQLIKTGITGFYNDITNWIIWLPGYKGYWEPQNIKNVLTKGIEVNLSINGYLGEFGYHFGGNYAFTRAINNGDPPVWGDQSHGKQLVYIPVHSGNFMAGLEWKDFSVSYQHNAFSERFTTSSNDKTQRNRLNPYFMNDLIFGKKLILQKFTISAEVKIYNLFNEKYYSVLNRPMPGRNYVFMIMMKF
jgi:outer membrane cobalamin receptor